MGLTGKGDGTRCVSAGQPEPRPGQPFLPGPVFAAPYHLGPDHVGPDTADFYGRAGNPTWRALESAIGELDGGDCVLFPSGMAAITTVLRELVEPGDVLVVPSDGYYAVREFVRSLRADVRAVPTIGPWTEETVAGAKLVLVETPANPGLDVCDIALVSGFAHEAGALLAVDNTTATPLGQRPLELGADLTVASDTKALTGHSDLVLGHVSTTDTALAGRLRAARSIGGLIPGPFESWLAHRDLATLDLRLARQAENAALLVDALRGHPLVSGLRWPGSPDDPAYPIASAQMRRFGGVLSFTLPSAGQVDEFVARCELVLAATSFGGLHSTADRRARWGDPVPDGFVRFSCGCENGSDLVNDVLGSLDLVQSSGRT